MTRFTVALASGLAILCAAGGDGIAADLGRYRAGDAVEGSGASVGRRDTRARPQYSYYGQYGYPAPFGYGYTYAPTPGRNMEYGYYGPNYFIFAPDHYRGPIFGYHEW